MLALSMQEICERWAKELDRPPEDVARTLAADMLRQDNNERALLWSLRPPDSFQPAEPREETYDVPVEEDEMVRQELGWLAYEGREANWGLLRRIVITVEELVRWQEAANALPSPKFLLQMRPKAPTVLDESRVDDKPSEPSRSVLLKALAAITMALAEPSDRFWKSANRLKVSEVVEETRSYLDTHPEIAEALGEKGLSRTRLSDCLSAALTIMRDGKAS